MTPPFSIAQSALTSLATMILNLLTAVCAGALSGASFELPSPISVVASAQLVEAITVDDTGQRHASVTVFVKNTGNKIMRVQGWLPMGAERQAGEKERAYKWLLRFRSADGFSRFEKMVPFPFCCDIEPNQQIQGLVSIQLGKSTPNRLSVELVEPNGSPVYGSGDTEFFSKIGNDFDHPKKAMLAIKQQLEKVIIDLNDRR